MASCSNLQQALRMLDDTIATLVNKNRNSAVVMSQKYTKNVLITGGVGFIGSQTAIFLVNKYPSYNFIVIDALNYSANIKNLKSIENASNFKFIHGSICSTDLMRHIFVHYNINVVIHFAAESHVDHSFNNAFQFTQTNIMGTHILLECARRQYQQSDPLNKQSNFELFMHISTDEVYGESNMSDQYCDAKKENDVLLPTTPYAASKAAAEMIVHSYSKSFKLPVIVTRSSNIYGPHQFPEKLIPKFIYLINNNKPVCIYGNGLSTRIYIYIDDIVRAFDLIMHSGKIGEIYNITGMNHEYNTIQVVNNILSCFKHIKLNDYAKYISFVRDRVFNDMRYYMNGDKLTKLGWKPSVSFENGLEMTVKWYLNNQDHWENLDDVLVAHPTNHRDTNTIYGGDKK